MKFKTAELIKRIDDLIILREQNAETKHAEAVQQHAAKRSEWLEEYGPAYVEFANRIKEKIRKDRPILESDIPERIRNRYGYPHFREGKAPEKQAARIGELRTLKAALEAVTDEYVTTTGLREVGFKNIPSLFSAN